jgi:hypothetical protein
VRSAAAAGAGGALIDTHSKDGGRLLDWRTPARLGIAGSRIRSTGWCGGLTPT